MDDRPLDHPTDFSELEVILVSKRECHLCDAARDVVERVRRDHPFPLRVIEIRPGDEWHAKYWDRIPVLLIEGRVAFIYRIDPEPLLEKLVSARRTKERKAN
jgi:hypothetical protein